jgi:transcriptional regulator with XRE-family HTH domain
MRKTKETSQVHQKKPNKSIDMSAHAAYSAPVRRTYTREDVLDMLKKKQGDRSLRRFAEELEISAAYLSDIYRGNRRPGKSVLLHLGLAEQEPAEPMYVAS